MFNRDNKLLLEMLTDINKRSVRIETRLFRLAKAMGLEEAMHSENREANQRGLGGPSSSKDAG